VKGKPGDVYHEKKAEELLKEKKKRKKLGRGHPLGFLTITTGSTNQAREECASGETEGRVNKFKRGKGMTKGVDAPRAL